MLRVKHIERNGRLALYQSMRMVGIYHLCIVYISYSKFNVYGQGRAVLVQLLS